MISLCRLRSHLTCPIQRTLFSRVSVFPTHTNSHMSADPHPRSLRCTVPFSHASQVFTQRVYPRLLGLLQGPVPAIVSGTPPGASTAPRDFKTNQSNYGAGNGRGSGIKAPSKLASPANPFSTPPRVQYPAFRIASLLRAFPSLLRAHRTNRTPTIQFCCRPVTSRYLRPQWKQR